MSISPLDGMGVSDMFGKGRQPLMPTMGYIGFTRTDAHNLSARGHSNHRRWYTLDSALPLVRSSESDRKETSRRLCMYKWPQGMYDKKKLTHAHTLLLFLFFAGFCGCSFRPQVFRVHPGRDLIALFMALGLEN